MTPQSAAYGAWPEGVPVCPDRLHAHPLPRGYFAAAEQAERRLAEGWKNRRCRKCRLYGWVPPLAKDESEARDA